MRAVRAIVVKELREIWRDPLSLSLALVLPLVLLLLFTYGLNLDVQPVRLGVYDLDRSAASRDYLAGLSASGDLRVKETAASAAELGAWLDRGQVDLGLILPPDFERTLLAGRPAGVQVLVDGAYPPKAKAALGQLDAAAAAYSLRLAHDRAATALPAAAAPAGMAAGGAAGAMGPLVVPEVRVWFNPELRSVNYVVPGLFSLILMVLPPLLCTLAIVRERERGSVQHILVAPVSPTAFILGKALPYALLAVTELLLVLAAGLLWFRVPFRGSLALFLAAGVIYVFCTVGLGLFISTVTRSQVVAMLLALVATFMPSFLFSGFLFPMYSMPVRYQWISLAFPARHFTEISRGLALKGAGMAQLWPQYLALVAFAATVLLLTVTRFHRRVA